MLFLFADSLTLIRRDTDHELRFIRSQRGKKKNFKICSLNYDRHLMWILHPYISSKPFSLSIHSRLSHLRIFLLLLQTKQKKEENGRQQMPRRHDRNRRLRHQFDDGIVRRFAHASPSPQQQPPRHRCFAGRWGAGIDAPAQELKGLIDESWQSLI